MNFEKILGSHNIIPTDRRIKVLKIILALPEKEFTMSEIATPIKTENPLAGRSSITNTLILFRNTRLIKEVQYPPEAHPKIGRPKAKYILTLEQAQ